ncbi:MAG: arylsulfatase [Planctomycetota bacterium]|jgi:arylsulfatase A-like enzyme|nr:arylsulfatase [Planctomycetota bacterium]
MPNPTESKPNLIVILADDMGFSDIGCYGSEIATPNLDRLAAGGLRLSGFTNCARCCPTRASLMTGLYPHQAGVGKMVGNEGTAPYQGYLRDDTATLPESLRAAGYRTLMSGKWHCGGHYPVNDPDTCRELARQDDHPLPTDRGFDTFYGTLGGAGSYFRPPTLMRDATFIDVGPDEDYYYSEAIGTEAVRMIEETPAEQPFFLYTAFTAPHWPLHAREADIAPYRERYAEGWDALRAERYARLQELGIISAWPLSPRDPGAKPWAEADHKEWEIERMAVYAAMVTAMDRAIGTILDTVTARGQLDNTFIMFLSDNGGCAEFLREDGPLDAWPGFYAIPTADGRPVHVGNNPGVRPGPADTFMSYDTAWANASNTPFRLFKSWTHEGGVATPCVVHLPHQVSTPGAIAHGPWHVVDIAATCLDLAGATPLPERAGKAVQTPVGESFASVLSNPAHQRSGPIYYEHIGCRAIRRGADKAVWRRDRDQWELYDMERDRTELADRALSEPERLAALTADWQQWAERVGVFAEA